MGMGKNYKRIDLIRGSHPPERERERERKRERCTNALSNWFIFQ